MLRYKIITPAPDFDPTPSVSPVLSLSSDANDSASCASSHTMSEQRRTPTDGPKPLSCPDDKENNGMCMRRTWIDIHPSFLHTDRGVFVSVRGIKDADELDGNT